MKYWMHNVTEYKYVNNLSPLLMETSLWNYHNHHTLISFKYFVALFSIPLGRKSYFGCWGIPYLKIRASSVAFDEYYQLRHAFSLWMDNFWTRIFGGSYVTSSVCPSMIFNWCRWLQHPKRIIRSRFTPFSKLFLCPNSFSPLILSNTGTFLLFNSPWRVHFYSSRSLVRTRLESLCNQHRLSVCLSVCQ